MKTMFDPSLCARFLYRIVPCTCTSSKNGPVATLLTFHRALDRTRRECQQIAPNVTECGWLCNIAAKLE